MLRVKVVAGLIDRTKFRIVDDGVHVAIDRLYIPYKEGVPNVGHTLGDEVVSVFRALDQWDLLLQPVHVYLNDVRPSFLPCLKTRPVPCCGITQ